MPQNTEQVKKRKVSIFTEAPIQRDVNALGDLNYATVYRNIRQQYWDENPEVERFSPESTGIISELYQNRLRELETDLGSGSVIRDSTFIKEAEKFKSLNPNLDVNVFPFFGKDELSESIKLMQQQAGNDSLDIGIFGHAGTKFGGVPTSDFKQIYEETGEDCSKVGGVYVGSCSYGRPSLEASRQDIANAFKAPVKAQSLVWHGARARTLTEERDLISKGADSLGSRIFTPGSTVTTTKYKKKPKYIEPTISRPGVFDALSVR